MSLRCPHDICEGVPESAPPQHNERLLRRNLLTRLGTSSLGKYLITYLYRFAVPFPFPKPTKNSSKSSNIEPETCRAVQVTLRGSRATWDLAVGRGDEGPALQCSHHPSFRYGNPRCKPYLVSYDLHVMDQYLTCSSQSAGSSSESEEFELAEAMAEADPTRSIHPSPIRELSRPPEAQQPILFQPQRGPTDY